MRVIPYCPVWRDQEKTAGEDGFGRRVGGRDRRILVRTYHVKLQQRSMFIRHNQAIGLLSTYFDEFERQNMSKTDRRSDHHA